MNEFKRQKLPGHVGNLNGSKFELHIWPRKAPGRAVAELVATYPASQLLLIRQRHTGVPAPKLML